MAPMSEEHLAAYLSRLLELVEQMMQGRTLSTTDHFGMMCLCCLTRQTEHGGSLVRIRPSLDCELIARSMLEGYCQLAWAAQEPEERGTR